MKKKKRDTMIRVDPEFRTKLNVMRELQGFPSIASMTKELARDQNFDETLAKLKKKKKNGFFI